MYMIHKHKTMAENWNMSMIFKLYKKCNLDIYKLSKNYIVHTLVCFCNSFKTKAGRLKPMNVKDKTECKKGLIKSNYLVSYLLRSLKKMWRLKGVKGERRHNGVKIFVISHLNLTRFYGSSLYSRLKLLKSHSFLSDWFLFNVWGQKFGDCLNALVA